MEMIKSKHLTSIFIFLISLIFCFSASAQQSNKKTTINFEDQLIEGQAKNPDLLIMLKKKKFNYKKLIRLRENFLPELRKTSSEINPVQKIKERSRE